MEVYLDHLKGERAGALDRFAKDVIRVGRHAEFELCFDDLGVSYEHAELRLRDGDFWLVDRGSTNGSYVNEERAYNARLKDGDIVRFGKKGPVVRFRIGAPPAGANAGEAPTISPAVIAAGERDPKGSAPPFDLTVSSALIKEAGRKVASDEPLADLPPLAPAVLDAPGAPKKRSRRVTIPNMPALEPEPAPKRPAAVDVRVAAPQHHASSASDSSGSGSDGASSGSALEARRAGERRISVTPRPARGVYVALGALSLLAVFGSSAAVMFWMEADRKGRDVDDWRHRAEAVRKEYDDYKKSVTDQEREKELTALRQRDETARLVENLEKSLEHERKESKRIDRESRTKIEELQQELARAKGEIAQLSNQSTNKGSSDNRAWKVIHKRLARSIVLVATSIRLKKKDGTFENFVCFGSGFFISKEGHIVTNKHVVEPWKFRPLALRLAQEDLEPDLSSYQLAVWIAETRFASGQQLDLSTGYSTAMKTLEKVRTPRDVMTPVVNPGDKGPRNIMIHHESSNEDLALLKASGGPFEPIPLRRSSDGQCERFDPVMVLGFPAGPAILEKGVAETSPSLGQIRKVEDTIYVSASMMGGNSGGPLIDTEGRVVGVATRIVNGTEALGICLKVDHVIDLYDGGSW